MDRQKAELLNIVTDLRRALMDYVNNPQTNYSTSTFLQNITKNFPRLLKTDSRIADYVQIDYLKDDSDPALVKAEKLLMMANRLQNYLIY